MAIQFDAKKGQQAADELVSIMNGDFAASVVELYGTVRKLGEDNPIVDAPCNVLKEIEAYFNDEIVPAANSIQGHFMEYAEAANAINNAQAAKTAAGEEVGAIGDTTYDAAKNL